MLYTLLKFLGWGILLAVVGGCVGWALRALKARGEVARARSSTVDPDEVERMRHRLANLEHAVAERDRLRIQLADLRHVDSPGIVGADLGNVPDANDVTGPSRAEVEPGVDVDGADADGVAHQAPAAFASRDASDDGESDGTRHDAAAEGAATTSTDSDHAPEAAVDLDAAAAVLGKQIALDDLTVVEGIGPKIAELCAGIGVSTWRQLADTDVADLQSMLDSAGSRYAVHEPASWPEQAALLADGEWEAFTALTDALDAGR